MKERTLSLVGLLSGDACCSAADLATRLGVSDRTVRSTIRSFNERASVYGARIETVYGRGYRLVVDDPDALSSHLRREQGSGAIPRTPRERRQYLLEYLLTTSDYVRKSDLEERLFVSTKVLTEDLHEVESVLSEYGLALERRPNHGVRVTGSEFDRRLCIASVIEQFSWNLPDEGSPSSEVIEHVLSLIRQTLDEADLSVPETVLYSLSVHVLVAARRIRAGAYVPVSDGERAQLDQATIAAARAIAEAVGGQLGVTFPDEEVDYLAIHLSGKRSFEEAPDAGNITITSDVDETVRAMIARVDDAYPFGLGSDLELHMNLCRHVGPLGVRLHYGMHLKNPLLPEIREKYFLAYSMAALACTVLEEKYDAKVSEDEVGYVALALALALERRRTGVARKRILLVYGSGATSAQLVKYKYEQEFADCTETIETVNAASLGSVDFSRFDYVLSTVPVRTKVPVPILRVSLFSDWGQIDEVRRVIESDGFDWISAYYHEELFVAHLDACTREEALARLCALVGEECGLQGELLDLVLKRERLAPTSFGNRVAMPHPIRTVSEQTFVCVGVLDKPIRWVDREVQVVFLVSVARSKRSDIQRFYQTTARYLMDERAISHLIERRSYEELVRGLEATRTD